jgi:hypothetical protein
VIKIGDLISVRDFPAVVQADDIQQLRSQRDAAAIDDFVGGYLGFDERSRDALRLTIQSLAAAGGAFFLNGVFGSGKSHLLGLMALLSDRLGHRAFAALHPHLASNFAYFSPRLVLHFSLDAYDATRFSLEEIFWRELQAEWQRRDLPPAALTNVLETQGARSEQWTELDEVLRSHQLGGLVLCVDELSLFLSAKEHRALQADAAFLQFLGQRARRQSTLDAHRPGLWVFAALQKSVENIGDLEAYSLSQIRDRFTTIQLSIAHVPSLIEHRLIEKKDAEALHQLCQDSFESTLRALPQLDFGREEWERLYPFHPATVALLEAVVARFFSRTRSAVLFCRHSVNLESPAQERVLPDALFDYLVPEWEEHPDLRPLATVWRHWQESAADVAGNADDAAMLLRVMKGLLLFKIAGVAPTAQQLANALHLDAKLRGDGNYQYTKVLCERLQSRGSYLAVERNEDQNQDRYAIDIGTRVGEMARRAIQSTLRALPDEDARISQYIVSCCRNEPLPLAVLDSPRSLAVMWRNAPRSVQTLLWTSEWNAERLANTAATLSTPGYPDDLLLLVAPPFITSQAPQTAWQDALAQLTEARWRGAIVLWTPRAPLPDEWQSAREATAQHLLESDPQLLDNRRGRAVLAHIKNETSVRESQLARLAQRLLREGQLQSGAHLTLDASELAQGETWTATLEAIAEWSLPPVFPQWEPIAPRLRVLTPGNVEQLCLEILRRPADAPFYTPSLERAVRGIAEPLGLAKAQQGRWTIQPPRPDLAQTLKELIGEGAPLSHLEATLAKSEWGLRAEQTHLLICALLRSGELLAFDGRGQALPTPQIGLPLRRSVHTLRPGQQLELNTWSNAIKVLSLLGHQAPATPSFAAQEAARVWLTQWRAEAVAQTELAQARWHQLRRELGHDVAQWPRTQSAWEQIEKLLHALEPSSAPLEVLARLAAFNAETLRPALLFWREQLERLEAYQSTLLQAHAFLTHPQLAVPPELASTRDELLQTLQLGEAILEETEFAEAWLKWRAAYAQQYREWHSAQHAPERWNSLRRLASSDLLRVAEQLHLLRNRSFEGAIQVRAALAEEFDKACPHDGTLRHEPVCPACRLRWGERVLLCAAEQLETSAQQDVLALRSLLHEDAVRLGLRRHAKATSLLDWSQSEPLDVSTLRPLLSEDVLRALDDALRPRRCVTRSQAQLMEQFTACRTRDDFQSTFKRWLDSNENLADDDEIVLEP